MKLPEIPNWLCYLMGEKLQDIMGLEGFGPKLFLEPKNVRKSVRQSAETQYYFDGPNDKWEIMMSIWKTGDKNDINYMFGLYYHMHPDVQTGHGWSDVLHWDVIIEKKVKVFNKPKRIEWQTTDKLIPAIHKEKAQETMGHELGGLLEL